MRKFSETQNTQLYYKKKKLVETNRQIYWFCFLVLWWLRKTKQPMRILFSGVCIFFRFDLYFSTDRYGVYIRSFEHSFVEKCLQWSVARATYKLMYKFGYCECFLLYSIEKKKTKKNDNRSSTSGMKNWFYSWIRISIKK